MSVAIRLSRAGRVHLPYYHIGVFDSRTRRDGRPVEELGFYNPKSDKEPVRLDLERAKHWLSVGARPSATVATILKAQGIEPSAWAVKKTAKAKAGGKAKKPAGKPAAKRKAATKAKPPRKPRTANSKARGEKKNKPAG